jgi:hypothetical protein
MSNIRPIVCGKCRQVNRIASGRPAAEPRCGPYHGPLFETYSPATKRSSSNLNPAASSSSPRISLWKAHEPPGLRG